MRFLLILFTLLVGCVTQKDRVRSDARLELGTAYLKEGKSSDAIKTLEQAIKLNPRNAAAWEKLALAYSARGAPQLAEEAFIRSLAIEDRPETHNNYALMLRSLGRYQEAVLHFEAAINDLTYRNNALALHSLGQTHYEHKNYEGALAAFSQSIQRAPNLCINRFLRGLTYNELNKSDEALYDFQQVIELCGDEAFGAYLQAAELLLLKNDRPAACTYLETILNEVKDTPLGSQAAARHTEECL